jgi:hypothetical protein
MKTLALAIATLIGLLGPVAAEETLNDFVWMERPVPEITFVDGSGAAQTLEDFKGRVVLLNIWAT